MEIEGSEIAECGGLCKEMQLLEYPDQYIITPSDGGSYNSLFISRSDGSFSLSGESPTTKPSETTVIFGIAGVIRLLAGAYLLLITSRVHVGSHGGFPVFKITSLRFLSCNKTLNLSTAEEKRDEAYFVSLLKAVEKTSGLYYSYETDLTLNTQRRSHHAVLEKRHALWKQADPRYVWNRYLMEELIEAKLEPYILPIIQGSFQILQIKFKNRFVKLTLISRKCMRRIGTRMWRRGADLEGHAANFIETEQLLEVEGYTASYIQVRGSIPVLWEQIVDLSYKPKLNILNTEETPMVAERHFNDLVQRYGTILAVDLVNQGGDEGSLSVVYANAVKDLKNIRYVSFDFHHICGQKNFDRLDLLHEQIAENVKQQGYFLGNQAKEIIEDQTGVVRVNCIDCLDRTNVTQCFLAQKSLECQLRRIEVLNPSESVSQHSEFHQKFRILWADHGDELSIQYSGTHALKGDFVRYGRLTFSGMIKDGFSALARYYLNNFHDGIRQDAIDLVTGHYTVSRGIPSPFQFDGFELFTYLPIASALVVGGLTITTLSLQQAVRDAHHFLNSVVWAGITTGTMAIIKVNGRQFCSRPRLCKLY